jgi:hypothetical protein
VKQYLRWWPVTLPLLLVVLIGLRGWGSTERNASAHPTPQGVTPPGTTVLIPGKPYPFDGPGRDFALFVAPNTRGVLIPRAGALASAQPPTSLRFAPDVSDDDRRTILHVVSLAGPVAKRLIDAVDGLTVVSIRPLSPRLAGLATRRGPGHYGVRLNPRLMGSSEAQQSHTILHELGHVLDFALVSDRLRVRLAPQFPCLPTGRGRCSQHERFAQGFMIWALATGARAQDAPPNVRRVIDSWSRDLRQLVEPL